MAKCSYAGCLQSVNVLSFTCRCSLSFCIKHRLPIQHECVYDYKEEGRKRLIIENPRVVANRIEEI